MTGFVFWFCCCLNEASCTGCYWWSGYAGSCIQVVSLMWVLFDTPYLVKAMVFPVVMYGCEHWTMRKTECRRIDVFKLWCWRRLLRVPWTARTANQSILMEVNPEHSLEGLMLKLKLQNFGHLIWRADTLEKIKAKGEERNRGRDGWMASLTQWTWVWANSRR